MQSAKTNGAFPDIGGTATNIDKNISWSQLSPFAIRFGMEGNDEVWHAGCVRDVLVPPEDKSGEGGEILVATDTGGVWFTRSDGLGYPVSDWDKPDMWCLASFKGGGVPCVYAGGTGLYVTQTPTITFIPWREIALIFVNELGSDAPIGTVLRIAVMNEARVIVIACTNGVFWSPIPADSQHGIYQWKEAVGLPSENIRGFFGLTLGIILDDARRRWVVVSSWGTAAAPTAIFQGAFNVIGQLQFESSTIKGGIQSGMRATSLASCESDPMTMYAVSAGDDGKITAFLKSVDGGSTWILLSPSFGFLGNFQEFIDTAGNQGNDYRPCNAIAVSPRDPNTVVIAWRHEGLFYSNDGGFLWTVTAPSTHVHSDLHTVYFDPTDPSGQRIYTGGDGGVVQLPLGLSFPFYISKFNRSCGDEGTSVWPRSR
jgi:hypothetical protein